MSTQPNFLHLRQIIWPQIHPREQFLVDSITWITPGHCWWQQLAQGLCPPPNSSWLWDPAMAGSGDGTTDSLRGLLRVIFEAKSLEITK